METIICKKCGKVIQKKNNRKYCPSCSIEVQKEQARNSYHRYKEMDYLQVRGELPVNIMLEIQKLFKNKDRLKINCENIIKKFPNENPKLLKNYYNRLSKDEKEDKRIMENFKEAMC